MPPTWIGLTLAFVSALVTNTAYSLEHDAAAALPPLSPRRPFRSVQFLLRDRRWLIAFGAETAGWLMYVAALRLAPLALVQAVAASGVAVLAFATARGHPSRLARREQLAVVLALAGLTLLSFSLTGTTASDQHPPVIGVVIWLAACAGGAVLLIAIPTHFARAASLGLAAACSSPTATSPRNWSATEGCGSLRSPHSSPPMPSARACCSPHTSGATR